MYPSPEGPLGVIFEIACDDMIPADGNPLEKLALVTDPENSLTLIMKDRPI